MQLKIILGIKYDLIQVKTLMALIGDSYCQYTEDTHPFLCVWIPQQYLTLWLLANLRGVTSSKENINIIYFIFRFIISVEILGKECHFLCALQCWFSALPARVQYGSFTMSPSQRVHLSGSHRLFSKRKSTSMFKPCLCCIPWHAYKFQLTFNQYFRIVLISVFSQFSHLLTIRSVQTLGWSWYVCWLDMNYGLYSIFPVRKEEEIDRKTC